MSVIGYAIVNVQTGEIVERLPMLTDGQRVRIVHADGQSTWELPGWSDGVLAVVPVERDDVEPGDLESSAEAAPQFDGEKVAIAVSIAPLPQAAAAARIKAAARRVILARFPDWKQQNMTARGVELAFKIAEGGTFSETDQADAAALMATWAWIKAVRLHSDALESDYAAGSAVTLSSGWPE